MEGSRANLICDTDININSTVKDQSRGDFHVELTDFQVSWIRCQSLQILSVGFLVFTHNSRYSVSNMEQDWVLRIDRVRQEDGGEYECQVVDREKETRTLVLTLQVIDSSIAAEKNTPRNMEFFLQTY